MNKPATILFAALNLSTAWSQTHSVNPAIVDGEELRHKVKWQFVRREQSPSVHFATRCVLSHTSTKW